MSAPSWVADMPREMLPAFWWQRCLFVNILAYVSRVLVIPVTIWLSCGVKECCTLKLHSGRRLVVFMMKNDPKMLAVSCAACLLLPLFVCNGGLMHSGS